MNNKEEFEVGKVYRYRNGRKAIVIANNPELSEDYPIATVSDYTNLAIIKTHTKTGRISSNDEAENQYDLLITYSFEVEKSAMCSIKSCIQKFIGDSGDFGVSGLPVDFFSICDQIINDLRELNDIKENKNV